MDDYAGRVLADRYRLPLPPADAYELTETRAFDTYSGQEVLIRQVPLPEVVEAEVLDAEGLPEGFTARDGAARPAGRSPLGRAGTRRPADPLVRHAIEAAQAAARIPDHPRLDQVFDVFAEDGSLWVVSELVAARPLAALLAEEQLSPYRAAEVASDVLMALRVLHGHGWVHRNLTARTVLVCDDGRVMLTGLAVGAAEEALCGYDPVPEPEGEPGGGDVPGGHGGFEAPAPPAGPDVLADPEAARRAAIRARSAEGSAALGAEPPPGLPPGPTPGPGRLPAPGRAPDALDTSGDIRAARAGAIAAYREGARAAARVQEAQNGRAALPGARPAPETRPAPYTGDAGRPLPGARPAPESGPAPGRIADPYGVGTDSWHGAAPRTPAGGQNPPGRSVPSSGGWDEPAAPARRGPATALAAERARQTRMAVVGPVTERWAPEQAGPVHENWRLAPPIGPATDLWALGALLFRAVQGHAPYPEESTAELVQMVCAEPPAFAEECGPLRPVVESLLRQDPTERIDFEELSGWLRSLVRSAPEPDAGLHVVAAPPADTGRLPVVRRRGELVRRRRAGLPAHHGRHKRARQETGSPRSLGRLLLLLVLAGMAAAITYAMLFLPKAETDGAAPADRTGAAGGASQAPPPPTGTGSDPHPDQKTSGGEGAPTESAASTEPQTTDPKTAEGFTLRTDPEGFRVAVADGWNRAPANGRGQVVYSRGGFELLVVPGRDSAQDYGTDPMAYQRDSERELQPYRDSTWATSTGLKSIEVGGRTMAEGQFTWTDPRGRELYVRNLAMLIDGRYHVVQVRGPEAERDEVTRLYEQASATYTPTR
ncbi:protein kinase [Streptomyces leeuwenhoekii]|uniref:Serine/Threonine Protein Kinase n=1 Tax=Streptomyces leeuwenhoekii TaxID=1437453 RepID=A0A0F7VXW6_STRLW|nr:protein kinase [Streptomyces leeuwenhoekii]CQR62357.1 Serine/Threonine Protein Kinase [Streptomyces leeuwenhoekii]